MIKIVYLRIWLVGKLIILKNMIFRMKLLVVVLIGCLWCKIIYFKRNVSVRLVVFVREIWLISCVMFSIYLIDIYFIFFLLIVF